MATIAGLVVEISANARRFHRATEEIRRRAQRFAGQLRSIMNTAVKAVVAGATAAAAAVTATITQTSLAMRDLVRDAEAVGATARDLQTWQYAAKSAGIEADKVGDIFKDVNDKIGDFVRTGGGEAADVFNQLGLEARDFIGLSPDKALLRISSALDGLSQSEKTFFMESIADDASRLIPLLDNNAERFKTLAERGREWGNVMTDAEIKASAALGTTLTKAKDMASGFKQLLGANLAPTFQGVIAWMHAITDSMGGPRAAAASMAESIKGSLVFVANAVDGVVRVFELAGSGIAVMVLKAQSVINDLALSIYSGPVKAVNFLIEQWNKIPGMDLGSVSQPGFVEDLQNRSDMLKGAIGAGTEDLQSTAMESLAGDAIRKRIEEFSSSTQESVNAAQNFAKGVNAATGIMPTGSQSAVPERAGGPSAGLNLRSITPMSADQFTNSAPAGAALSGSAPKSRGSVHVTVTKDGTDVSGEVQGDDDFIRRMASALSSTASSV